MLEALRILLPNAPLYALVRDPGGYAPAKGFIHTSPLQRIPGAVRHYPKLLPLMPWAARRVKLPPADLVVCSDAAIAKAMTPHRDSKLVCYCHSPMRYAWEEHIRREYCATLPRVLRRLANWQLRRVCRADYAAAQQVDTFIANSSHVAKRIRRFYNRDSVVIHPPVELPPQPNESSELREDFYLCVGQHVAYKRLDLAVAACERLGRKLIVIGEGPDKERLSRESWQHVQFLGFQPDEVVLDHFRRAKGLLFPGEEDFGIVPVEAMAHGCPVIAYGVGGATETVVNNQTGVLFDEQSIDSLAAAIEQTEKLTFDPVAMHAHTQRFSLDRFLKQIRSVLAETLNPEK